MRTIYISILLSLIISSFVTAQHSCSLNMANIIPSGISGPDILPPPLDEPDPVSERGVEDYRMLYWLHGLNGDGGSWQKANGAVTNGILSENFPARKVYTASPSYPEFQADLLSAAAEVNTQIKSANTANIPYLPSGYDARNGMIIAHSQGGLVSRRLDMYLSNPVNAHERVFGGIITFNTSHQGARLLNNKNQFLNFMETMGKEMAAGPVEEKINNSVFLRILNQLFDLNELPEKITNFVVSLYGPILVGSETPNITKDYEVGATPIQELNNYQSDGTFMVPFYSVKDTITMVNNPSFETKEKDQSGNYVDVVKTIPGQVAVPISLATMQYFITKVNDVPHFKAQDHEHVLAARSHLTKLDYQAKVDAFNSKISELQSEKYWATPFSLQFYVAVKKQRQAVKNRNAYQRGVHFLNNFDAMYRSIIGAREFSTTSVTGVRVCHCELVNNQTGHTVMQFGSYYPEDGENCGDRFETSNNNYEGVSCTQTTESYTFPTWHHKDSDGVVLAESGMNIPQRSFDPQKIEGSTHMRVRNDDKLKVELNRIFTGGVGEFFQTDEKN